MRVKRIMKEMKYIIVRMECPHDPDMHKKEVAIVFPKCLTHSHVARVHRIGDQVLVSAGFCQPPDYPMYESKAYGHSESLNMSTRVHDAQIIDESYA